MATNVSACNISTTQDSKWSLTRRRPNIAYRSATSSPLHSCMCHPDQRDCPSIGNLVPHRSSGLGEAKSTDASQIHRLVAGERGKSRQCPFSTKVSPFSQYRKAMSDSHNLNSSLERFRPSKKCIEIDSSTFEDGKLSCDAFGILENKNQIFRTMQNLLILWCFYPNMFCFQQLFQLMNSYKAVVIVCWGCIL